ncbi:AI-2E family transporter [Acetilactobacillus jinshanensis]|uniref:AI-2E family transporter n=1 Tax=Acetilactobacillus jinshanensis TaxID=1720083 RepID=A0A4P6ZK05_9LACO|nr:AI-2E family transporter [Acetilactobacillus jinshanensis]QBP17873.1 AI-2E family transporter [Acetilactobacillus jinshanensis]URL60734.1 AI-2E family transporter [uncultured bacterium]
MFGQFKKAPVIFWSLEILIVFLIVWIGTKISFLFSPVGVFISSIIVPVIIAGALYYLLNPVVKLMIKIRFHHHHVSRTFAVAVIFIGILAILYYLITSFVPNLVAQISDLIQHIPHFTKETEGLMDHLSKHGWMSHLPMKQYTHRIQEYVAGNIKGLLSRITASLGRVISMATNFIIIIITVPVMLFYMLKDGDKLAPAISKWVPKRHRSRVMGLLNRMSQTISRYIGGQMIECLFVGTFTTIGYLLIGQRYAFLLGLFAGICNIIPYVGPYIGIAPSLMVALSVNITQVIWVIVVVIIVQQIDGNLIYPNVIGKTLQIHPLTIIIILLAAGHIAGLIGMILAIPLYAVVKTVVQYIYTIWLIGRTKSTKN